MKYQRTKIKGFEQKLHTCHNLNLNLPELFFRRFAGHSQR